MREINFVNINYKPFDAANWPLTPSGLLGPVISTVLAWIVFGESLTILQLFGGVVVIGALSLLVKDQRGPAESVVAHETS